MRRDVQKIFKATPHEKQTMMFSATLSDEIRPVCKKFMHNVRRSNVVHLASSLWGYCGCKRFALRQRSTTTTMNNNNNKNKQ